MPVKYELISNPDLPCLSWGAVISRGDDTARVYHGGQVEVMENAFLEGAWNGPFEDFPPISATVVCGSGGVCTEDRFLFWTSTDNTYPVSSIKKGESLFISNSLIFTMVLAGEEPDPAYPFYYEDLTRIVRMGSLAHGRLRTSSSHVLCMHNDRVIEINTDLEISLHRRADTEEPRSYDHYLSLLEGNVKRVLDNAASPSRRYPYSVVTCCSRGYDSNACMVLASKSGCEHAITLEDSKRSDPAVDSGAGIAAALGLHCEVDDRWEFLAYDDLAEFCSTPVAQHCSYKLFEDILRRRVLITGSWGLVWETERAAILDDKQGFWLRYRPNFSMLEFRLRVGFLLFPPCYIGATHNRAIHRITHSPEMEPWRIGGDYDRPIPRRIVEDAGIPRTAFGMRNLGSSHNGLRRLLTESEAFRRQYDGFMIERLAKVDRSRDAYWRARRSIRNRITSTWGKRKPSRMYRYRKLQQTFSFLYARPDIIDWYRSFAYQFSFESLKGRYGRNPQGSSGTHGRAPV